MAYNNLIIKLFYKYVLNYLFCKKIIFHFFHNIIQIHNRVLWDWRYCVKYSPHSDWM